MPIYDYICKSCSKPQQLICDFDEADNQVCEICENPMDRQVSLWAHTPARWGDSHGYFDRGLGMYIENSVHREKVMKEKGLRPVSEKELDDHQQAIHNDTVIHEKKVSTFNDTMKKTGSFAEAAKAITHYDPDPETDYRDWRFSFEKPIDGDKK